MPESVKRRRSSGPTIGAIVDSCSGVVAIRQGYAGRRFADGTYYRLMEVTVRLFAMLRERAGAPQVELQLPDGARVADAISALDGLADGLPLVMAVNREYARADEELHEGDELALIPPVSGGETAVSHA